MALKLNKNGTYTVKTKADVEEAIRLRQELKADIQEAENDATELTKAIRGWMLDHKQDEIKVEGFRAKMIVRTSGAWNGRKLRRILKGKGLLPVWTRVTTRVPDPDKIQEAVGEGLITMDEIEPAYEETRGAPYIDIRASQ